MASQALRTIGICYKQVDFDKINTEDKNERGVYKYEEDGYKLLTIVGIRDTIRDEVPLSI